MAVVAVMYDSSSKPPPLLTSCTSLSPDVMHLHMESDDSEHVTRSAVAESALSGLGPLLPPVGGMARTRGRGVRAVGWGERGQHGAVQSPTAVA